MNAENRQVDQAMLEDRPEKRTVRGLWLEEVKAVAREDPSSEEPWYLTLPGAEGLDIQLLLEHDLIALTEVNSIAEKDQGKIVAVESNNDAIAKLQKKFIGLRIKQVDFRSFIRSEGQFRWPEGDDEKYCRARVINLDLNTRLKANIDNQSVVFPVLAWIDKLCQIHAKPPRLDWTLCLTLHAEIDWPIDVNRYIQKYLCENLGREPVFDESCRDFFGEGLYQAVKNMEECLNFMELNREEQQKVIMVIVPKIIARLVHNKGWCVRTERNLRYGSEARAPMVTWVVKLTWDGNAAAVPDSTYREALREIFHGVGIVKENGNIA